MFKRKIAMGLTGFAVAGVLVGSAGAAFAGTSYTNFSTTVGAAGSAAYSNSQTKSTTSATGSVNPTFIGAGRTVSARMYRNSDGAQGTEHTGVSAGSTVPQENKFGSGQTVRTEFAGNWTWTNSTQIDGRWKSN